MGQPTAVAAGSVGDSFAGPAGVAGPEVPVEIAEGFGFIAEAVGFRVTYAALALLLLVVAALAGRVAAADGRKVQAASSPAT